MTAIYSCECQTDDDPASVCRWCPPPADVSLCSCGDRLRWRGKQDGVWSTVIHCPSCHVKMIEGYPCPCRE